MSRILKLQEILYQSLNSDTKYGYVQNYIQNVQEEKTFFLVACAYNYHQCLSIAILNINLLESMQLFGIMTMIKKVKFLIENIY